MRVTKKFDVIIIGGSFSGLSAAMSLGRSLRKVLIIDSGKPCNAKTPHAHNFITHDGRNPREIGASAKEQVMNYATVEFYDGLAVKATKTENGFEIGTSEGGIFSSAKLIIATGLKDVMPDIQGFAECWGKTIVHCPYCHGYEIKNEKTGLLLNGEMAFELSKLIINLTKDLTIFTNGVSTLSAEQSAKLKQRNIPVIETEVDHIEQEDGKIKAIIFKDQSRMPLAALYARPVLVQHSDIPESLGCEFTEMGSIKVDMLQKTTVPGVYACGDNSNFGRALAMAVHTGSLAGAMLNKELTGEEF